MMAKAAFLCLVSCVLGGDRFVRPGFDQTAPGYAESSYPAQPYSFGYDNVDEYGNTQFHKEQADANNVRTGSYGYTDVNGLYRRVNYVADANGFRATVETNEPGTQAGASADAIFNAKPVVVPPTAANAAVFASPAYANQAGAGYSQAGYGQVGYAQAGYGHAGHGHHGYGARS